MIAKEEIRKLAKLAKLKPNEKLELRLARWMRETLSYVEVLGELKTGKVEPTAQVTGIKNVTRLDSLGDDSLHEWGGEFIKTERVL